MNKNKLLTKKILLPALLALILTTAIMSMEKASPTATIVHANPESTVYLDPPTINGTVIGQEFTVNIMIRAVDDIHSWGAGMIFNATLLNCTGFFEGEFLKNVAATAWTKGTIDNTAGVITQYGSTILGDAHATGSGRLAYATFKVKAVGVSDIHLRDAELWKFVYYPIPVLTNIIDTYTVVLDTTPHTVVIVSNSTGKTGWYHSGFYAHAYDPILTELSFKVTGPNPGYSNVTIPKTLINVTLTEWRVIIDDIQLGAGEIIATENATHTSIYFTYSLGIHKIQITSRMSSTISMTLSSTSITLGSNVTISGNITAEDHTTRPNVIVTIQFRPAGGVSWYTAGQNLTDLNSNYTYTWTPATGGTHQVRARWEGDEKTIGTKSNVLALKVLYVFEPVQDVYVIIETNSTVAEFNSIPALDFSQPLKQISFNVTGQKDTKGYCNVTIPKTLLPPPAPEIRWKAIINRTLLSAEETIVTENTTHTFIYFTYTTSMNFVEITTRMESTISLALSSDSIDLGSSVTISGNITLEDHTVRSYANVTIHIHRSIYRPIDGTWSGLEMTETDENGNYTHYWTPEKAGIYEILASWEGDETAIRDQSDMLTLAVKESSIISMTLSSTSITLGSNVTISGAINPMPWRRNIVTIHVRSVGGVSWYVAKWGLTDTNGDYIFTWTPETPGTYEVKASWLGDEITYNATSNVLTLTAKWTSTISITLSSTEITQGKSVTINGNITAEDNIVRANASVTILYKLSGENWTTLATVETDSNGNYTYTWEPETDGTYYLMTSWEGDDITFGNESEELTLTVKKAPTGIPLEIVAVAVIAIIAIAAILVYFVKFRKPK